MLPKKILVGFLVLAGLAFGATAWANDTSSEETEALRQRLEALTKEIQVLKGRLESLEKAPKTAAVPAAASSEGKLVLVDSGTSGSNSDRFEFYGQIRGRYEYRANPTLDDQGTEDVDQMLLRTRIGVKANIRDDLSANILLQDSRVFGEEASTASDEEGVDLKIGTIDWTGLGDGVVDLHLGRQVLSYGEDKLVGHLEWVNTGRSFDAFRAVFHGWDDRWQADLFASVLDEEFGGDDDETFYGFYNELTLGADDNHSLQPYLFYRRNGDGAAFPGDGGLEEYTLGVRVEGNVNGWGYVFEGAKQFGDRGDLDIDAHALHGRLGYTWEDNDHKPKLFVEANLGTGDDDPTDGDWGRFDNLFPTNHMHYGYADYFSWANLEHYRLGFAFKPYDNGKFGFDFHKFALETTSDAWLNAGGGTVRSASPDADDDAGWEFDVTWKHKWDKGFGLLMGYSYFDPGDFASDTGTDDEVHFFYVQSHLNF